MLHIAVYCIFYLAYMTSRKIVLVPYLRTPTVVCWLTLSLTTQQILRFVPPFVTVNLWRRNYFFF